MPIATRPRLALRGGEPAPDPEELKRAADAVDAHPIAVELLRRRDVTDADEQRRYLVPRLRDLRMPTDMGGFDPALDLLDRARREGLRVGIFGDYDVDGVTTAAILGSFLEQIGVEVVTRVARRDSGYGFSTADAAALIEAGAKMVLTGDCGTSDTEALQYLRDRGVPTVVIDHHQVPEVMPPTDALINPHQESCNFPFKGLCSAGVAFYLCAALRTRVLKGGGKAPDPKTLLDMVALATVCDMVPLREENRILARQGLYQLGQRGRVGLRALLLSAGVDPQTPVDEEVVSFKLGPRLNAPGRLGPAEPALRLLRSRTDAEASAQAEQVESLNARRKDHTQHVLVEALAACEADPKLAERAALVVASESWMPGVVGIAANGVVERHRRPALVLGVDRGSGEARGSVRSFGGVDVRAALHACRHLLTRYGGHPQAAGASLPLENVDALREAFDEAVRAQGVPDDDGAVTYDREVMLEEIDGTFVTAVGRLGPYGVGFPRPVFLADDLDVQDVRVLKQEHLRLVLRQGGTGREAIAFRQAAVGVQKGDRVGVLFTPAYNVFRGEKRIQLDVKRLWKL